MVRLVACAALVCAVPGAASAGDPTADLRAQVEALRKRLDALAPPPADVPAAGVDTTADPLEMIRRRPPAAEPVVVVPAPAPGPVRRVRWRLDELRDLIPVPDPATTAGSPVLQLTAAEKDAIDVKKAVEDYMKAHPAGTLPEGFTAGWSIPRGFYFQNRPDMTRPKPDSYPFELDIHGRIQVFYENYRTDDDINHLTGQPNPTASPNTGDLANFSQIGIKRMRLIFEGHAFDPDVRYHIQFDGSTRGVGGVANNRDIQTGGAFAPNAVGTSNIGGGVTVDHVIRLLAAYVAYDFHDPLHPFRKEHFAGDGPAPYRPTFTAIAGKQKALFGLEEFLGSGVAQFVEYSMTNWFFDADDDSYLTTVGLLAKLHDDRLYLSALLTNGNESSFPNVQMDSTPGFIVSGWYDFGGTFDHEKQRWRLYGDCVSDIDDTPNPVVRLGGGANFVPMGKRSVYGDLEQSRVFTTPGAPGGTRLINILNGGVDDPTNRGAFAVDRFNSNTYNLFLAGKYHGWSVYNEWYLRVLDGFRGTEKANEVIVYTFPQGSNANADFLFPRNRAIVDYGHNLTVGYFVVPKKAELAFRWSRISGQSGNGYGNRRVTGFVTLPNFPGPVQVVDGAFRNFAEASEYTLGYNHYFFRHRLKWQNDVGYYNGGNPAGGGSSPTGFIVGQDGWLVRTQIQVAF